MRGRCRCSSIVFAVNIVTRAVLVETIKVGKFIDFNIIEITTVLLLYVVTQLIISVKFNNSDL